ncbi:hypothetical protein NP233_g2664 [Leucocoprinus birnbaumii]|uniref:Uncharacterized protein n=1 Tax=Leucocoprinus birnbaumii TaxID=56174 RepID=A0AAD5YUN4_9AGAR|nr:hypothetical protein NP233_g2664 [Leucocoprinus birnbaumii]
MFRAPRSSFQGSEPWLATADDRLVDPSWRDQAHIMATKPDITITLNETSEPRPRIRIHDLTRELIDQITIHLQITFGQDLKAARGALSTCCLASRLFVPSCRYTMFNSTAGLAIRYEDKDLLKLLELLESPVGTIGIGLKRITFVPHVGVPSRVTWVGPSARSMEALGDVRCAQFEGVPPTIGTCMFWGVLGAMRGIRDIRVEGGALMADKKLLEWICGLEELEELSILHSTARGDRYRPGVQDEELTQLKLRRAEKTHVRLLDIGGLSELGVLKWLLAQKPVPRVRGLRVGTMGGVWDDRSHNGGLQLAKRLFEVCGHGIGQLDLALSAEGDFGDFLDSIDLSRCQNLDSVHIEGLRVGLQVHEDNHQREALEQVVEKIFIKSSVGPQVNIVALTVHLDPTLLKLFTFFGIPDATLFEKFRWGKVPEILKRGWLGLLERGNHAIIAGAGIRSGDRRTTREYSAYSVNRRLGDGYSDKKELVVIVQGGWKYGREKLEDTLRRGAFHAFDEKRGFSVQFGAEGT